jgi:hypothetical protein
MSTLDETAIAKLVYIIRNHRVMLDSDLAQLYEVDTSQLTRQVRRNMNRFPEDFMFQLSQEEFELIQLSSGQSTSSHGGRRHMPLVFTETGVAMLSSVLTSERAAIVNIAIMRMFVRLRSFLAMESTLAQRVTQLESGTNQLFRIVFERLDAIQNPDIHDNAKKRIGLKDHSTKS